LNDGVVFVHSILGGSVLALMNTRLKERLKEEEILRIFSDVTEAIAYLHQLNPLIIHRDIKVENVLIQADGRCKLCDFGSATSFVLPPGQVLSVQKLRELETEIDRVTTLQYRAPEQCDLYQRQGLTEKVDIWVVS
jgi:serine/threonine protein kinase